MAGAAMSTLLHDLRYGVRMLLSGGPVTLVAIITVALGIGANSAIFSIVNGILLKPLPYERPDELLLIGERHGERPISVAWLNYLDWKAQNHVFRDIGATTGVFLNLVRPGAEPERLLGARVTAGYFSTLGVAPMLGRTFSDAEDSPGGEPTVVLSEGTWQRLFGGDRSIIGRPLTFSGTAYTVIGVMPASFVVQNPPVEAWISLGRIGDQMGPRSNHSGTSVVARLEPGVTMAQARADLDAIAARLAETYPATNRDIGVLIDSLHDRLLGQDLKRALVVLTGAVAFVLLIACANVTNLLLARGASRQREIAIRTALGAGRVRLLRQLLAESILLSGIGGAAGMLLGAWGVRVLTSAVPDNVARLDTVRVDGQVLAFTVALTMLTGVMFGLAPALQVSKPDLNETLKEGSRGAGKGTRAQRMRTTLVVAQMALSLVLLIGAGLMLRSFGALQASSPGVDPTGVVTGGVTLPGARYVEDAPRRQFYRQVVDRLQSTPGVDAVGAITPLPLSGGGWQTSLAVEGYPVPEPGKFPTTDIARITPDYFRAMGVRLLRGRAFTWRDDENAPLVAIIDETFANTWFANQDPIGRRIKMNAGHPPPGGPPPPWVAVVGVVNHVKNYGIDQESRVEVYLPFMQSTLQQLTLVVKGRGDAASIGHAMRQAVREADPTLPVFSIRTMEEYLARTLTSKRLLMIVLSLFAGVALALAAVGVYGVMSYAVAQRTSEIGIRMALGAYPRDVLRLVVGQGMLLTAGGLLVGLAGAFFLTRVIASMLFGVSATDPLTFAWVALLLAAVAFVATWVPARRASGVDPLIALRRE
jgi:putative ABC transport system permease protein